MPGVATSLSKFILPEVTSETILSESKISAPASLASDAFVSSHKTATRTFLPFPFGKLTFVLKPTSSFFCLRFNLQETSIDSSNLVVQLTFIFLIASAIEIDFLSFLNLL